MKFLSVVLVPLVCAAVIPSEFSRDVEMARRAPGEFAADALLRIAATGKVGKSDRIELLEEAFRRAGEAQQRFKRHPAIVKGADSASFLQHAYDQNLDGLSLRLRAVDAMLQLDAVKARSLFLEIPALKLPKLNCSDYLVYDAGFYYAVLGRVAKQSFNSKEVADGEPVRLLARSAAALGSASEVEPAGRMIAESDVSDAGFQDLLVAFSRGLSQIYGDDRSFTASAPAAGQQILALVEQARKRKVQVNELLEAYRKYLINNLAGQRCADDDLMESGESFVLRSGDGSGSVGAGSADFFNQKLVTPPVQPLRADDITPARIEGTAAGLRSCDDSECRQVGEAYRKLIFGAHGVPLSTDQKRSPEWQAQVDGFLKEIAGWKDKTGADEAGQFRYKCALYNALVGVMPDETGRERVMLSWLAYLEGNRMEQDDRIEWFLPVNAMIGRAALERDGLRRLNAALQNSHDPVIALYVELERLAPRTPDQVLRLM